MLVNRVYKSYSKFLCIMLCLFAFVGVAYGGQNYTAILQFHNNADADIVINAIFNNKDISNNTEITCAKSSTCDVPFEISDKTNDKTITLTINKHQTYQDNIFAYIQNHRYTIENSQYHLIFAMTIAHHAGKLKLYGVYNNKKQSLLPNGTNGRATWSVKNNANFHADIYISN